MQHANDHPSNESDGATPQRLSLQSLIEMRQLLRTLKARLPAELPPVPSERLVVSAIPAPED
jgi:hypothetical protein